MEIKVYLLDDQKKYQLLSNAKENAKMIRKRVNTA